MDKKKFQTKRKKLKETSREILQSNETTTTKVNKIIIKEII